MAETLNLSNKPWHFVKARRKAEYYAKDHGWGKLIATGLSCDPEADYSRYREVKIWVRCGEMAPP